LVVAAIGKSLDARSFSGSLETFTLVPQGLRDAAEVLVPLSEAAAFGLLLSGYTSAANAWGMVVVGFFSAVLAWHWIHNEAPTCACLGAWQEYFQVAQSASGIMRRNLVLIGVAGVSIAWSTYATKARPTPEVIAE
jgi:hypothetical protein